MSNLITLKNAKPVAFVRFVDHGPTDGHFESLRGDIFNYCHKVGVSLHFFDVSGVSQNEILAELFRLLKRFSIGHFFCEWMHDILDIAEIDVLAEKLGIKWSVLSSISEVWEETQSNSFEKRIRGLSASENLSAVFVWDRYAIYKVSALKIPFVVIPDSQSVSTNLDQFPCCSWHPRNSRLVIGVIGQLYGYRGTSGLIRFGFKHPGFRYFFWGSGRWRSVGLTEKFQLKILSLLKIAFVSDSFKRTEEDLNHGFKHLDAVFLDGSTYPNPSGIVTRARHFGIPVLVNLGMGYYLFQAKMDQGIRIINSKTITSKELRDEINLGRSFPAASSVSGAQQAEVFVRIWSGQNG